VGDSLAQVESAAHVVVESLEVPTLAHEDARHLGASLRLRAGERVSVTDGRGAWRVCRYEADGGLVADSPINREPRRSPILTVAFAPVKGDRPEWAVQKLTEVGVDRILLMQTERSVVRWSGSRATGHVDRLRKVARQASMQSRRCWLPDVEGVVAFAELASGSAGSAVMASVGGPPPSLETPTVLVGPEGGWSDSENAVGLPLVGLGAGVLRTESAAVAAGVLMVALRAGVVRPA
jgi:16S rRNA (uracil1498-N3)-methyltransferase